MYLHRRFWYAYTEDILCDLIPVARNIAEWCCQENKPEYLHRRFRDTILQVSVYKKGKHGYVCMEERIRSIARRRDAVGRYRTDL